MVRLECYVVCAIVETTSNMSHVLSLVMVVEVFVYAPPSIGFEVSTLLARSFFPVHPLCAAIQSIFVCRRDIEGDKKIGLGRIIFPAILLQ